VLALVIVVGAVLVSTGAFGGGKGASVNNATAATNVTTAEAYVPPPPSGNSGIATAPTVPPSVAGTPRGQVVAQLQSRLPLRDGPVTLQSVTISPDGRYIYLAGTTTLSLNTGPDWQRMNAALQTSVCAGPLGQFIPGPIISVDLTDAMGRKGGQSIMSCDRSTSGNPYYRDPSLMQGQNSSQK
jgi:hypothetical protein